MAKTLDYASQQPTGDLQSHGRAATAALLGLGVQLALAALGYVLFVMSRAVPSNGVFVFAVLGLIPWLAIAIALSFRRARTVEEFELEAARRSGDAGRTIFESELDARPAARRLARVNRYLLPAAAILLGLLLVLTGLS